VGAPKSGTTAMYTYLAQHPDVYLPERKELRFFGKDLIIRNRTPLSLDDYLAYFDEAGSARRVGTAYVWYLYSSRAAQEIRSFSPQAQIIVMLRNPVDMLHALHSEFLFNANEDIDDFAEALAAEDDRRQFRRIPRHAHLLNGLWYRSVPRYTEQLRRYFDVFGRDRVQVLIFDDFVSDTAESYRSTLRFLGLDAGFVPAFEVVNANKRLRVPALRPFLAQPPPTVRRIARALVPGSFRRRIYRSLQEANISAGRRASLSRSLREVLAAEFAQEVEQLSQLLERDLTHWTTH
jgi:hypothetical protein